MKTEVAIKHFGSAAALAKSLGISKSAVSQWGERVPEGRAFQLEVITRGALKADPERNSGAATAPDDRVQAA